MKCFWKNKIYPTLMTCFLLAGQFTQTAAIAGEWDVQESQADTEGADYQNSTSDIQDSEQEILQDYVTEELNGLTEENTAEPAFSQMIDDSPESNGADVFNDEMPDAETGDYVDFETDAVINYDDQFPEGSIDGFETTQPTFENRGDELGAMFGSEEDRSDELESGYVSEAYGDYSGLVNPEKEEKQFLAAEADSGSFAIGSQEISPVPALTQIWYDPIFLKLPAPDNTKQNAGNMSGVNAGAGATSFDNNYYDHDMAYGLPSFSDDLPSAFDLRNNEGLVKKALHQGNTDSCWAYAATAAGEITAGAKLRGYASAPDDSEAYLAYFAHQKINGEGAVEYTTSGAVSDPLQTSGTVYESGQFLTTSLGPACENGNLRMPSKDESAGQYLSDISSLRWNDTSLLADHVVTDVEFLPEVNRTGNLKQDENSFRYIKEALMGGHAVVLSAYFENIAENADDTTDTSAYSDCVSDDASDVSFDSDLAADYVSDASFDSDLAAGYASDVSDYLGLPTAEPSSEELLEDAASEESSGRHFTDKIVEGHTDDIIAEPDEYVEKTGISEEAEEGIRILGPEELSEHAGSATDASGEILPYRNTDYTNAEYNSIFVSYPQTATNHQFVVVGWDDTFSWDHYSQKADENGAWICRDSYGNYEQYYRTECEQRARDNFGKLKNAYLTEYPMVSEESITVDLLARWIFDKNMYFDEDGFFYLSYYDRSYRTPMIFHVEPRSFFSGEEKLQYDFLGFSNCTTPEETEPVSEGLEANVFSAEREHLLKHISVFTGECNSSVNVKVYLLNSDAAFPDDGTMIHEQNAVFSLAGYHILEVPEEVHIPAGAKFSVVVKIIGSDGSPYTPYEYGGDMQEAGGRRYQYVTAPNEAGCSYIMTKNGWTDFKDFNMQSTGLEYHLEHPYPGNALIRVFIEDIDPNPVVTPVPQEPPIPTVTPVPAVTPAPIVTPSITIVSIKQASVSGLKDMAYTGKALEPIPVIKLNNKTLKAGRDYSISYKDNKNVGLATVVLKGKGNYSGTVRKTWKILPVSISVSRLTAGAKSILVEWNKQSKQTDGYELQYCLNNSFKSGISKKWVKKTGTTRLKLTGLKGGKKYYIRIRTYRKVGDVNYYSRWSKVKSITTKKS